MLSRSMYVRQPLRAAARAFSTTTARADVARMTLIGRLGADVEPFTSSNGTEIMRYAVATNYGTQENKQTSWWRVQSFDNRPEAKERMTQMLKKGALVYVEGNAQMRKYEAEDGSTQNNLSITQVSYRILQSPGDKGAAEEAKA